MKVSVLTPTCDRPVGFALLERWMARQTLKCDEWIVADGGSEAVVCTMGQRHVHVPSPPGPTNFTMNLLHGLACVTGDIIVICEDDDWYAPTHLETLVRRLDASAGLLAGDDEQIYFNVAHRSWKTFDNKGASLCQTALKLEALPIFEQVIHDCLDKAIYGVDAGLWKSVPRACWSLERHRTVIGIKSLPGRKGLGIGHRDAIVGRWTADPDLQTLRGWIGNDADAYAQFGYSSG